jgi:hypothetical protein
MRCWRQRLRQQTVRLSQICQGPALQGPLPLPLPPSLLIDLFLTRFPQEGEMGWGLRALEDVPEGTLVIEYIGEVISETQMRVSSPRPSLPLSLPLDASLLSAVPSLFSLCLRSAWSCRDCSAPTITTSTSWSLTRGSSWTARRRATSLASSTTPATQTANSRSLSLYMHLLSPDSSVLSLCSDGL